MEVSNTFYFDFVVGYVRPTKCAGNNIHILRMVFKCGAELPGATETLNPSI